MKILLVLLAILKYTLLFILFLLLLIIVLAFIFMISPLRYTVTIRYKEKNIYLHVNATYLGKIVGFDFKFKNGKHQIILRLLFKKIKISEDKEVNKKSSKKKTDKDDIALKTVQKVTPTETLKRESEAENIKSVKSSVDDIKVNKREDTFDDSSTNSTDFEEKNVDNENESEPKKNLFDKINFVIEKINFYLESYKTYPYRDKLFKKLRKIFHNFFDSIIPKFFDISGLIYISSPATTGQLLGALYMLHGKCKRLNISVDADFENEKNDITALISGRIIIFKIIQPVISFVWLGLKAEAKRRKITRIQLIKILINNE